MRYPGQAPSCIPAAGRNDVCGPGYPSLDLPAPARPGADGLEPPPAPDRARQAGLVKAPSIGTLPDLDPLPAALGLPVLIKAGDDISTDEILPAGARVLPHRSNIARLADFAFGPIDTRYPERAREAGQHAIVGGDNYGQGSSREHAAIVPRYLGLRLVVAKSYARIHWQNLVNFGVLPLEFADAGDYDRIRPGDRLTAEHLRDDLAGGGRIELRNDRTGDSCQTRHRLSPRQAQIILAGGQIPLLAG